MQKKPEERGKKGGEKERNTAEIKKVEVITNKKDTRPVLRLVWLMGKGV